MTIRNHIFQEIFNAYESLTVGDVADWTGFRSIDVELFIKDNPDLPYLFDPITQSVVYYEKTIPLFNEAQTFYQMVREKFDNKEKMIVEDSREEFDLEGFDDAMEGSGRKRGGVRGFGRELGSGFRRGF